jgi:hypothetical protein
VTSFLDIERASGKVWITGLIAKLITAEIPPRLIHVIHNVSKIDLFSAMHESSYSSQRPIQAGVPQGSLFGPTLFNIYINDISSFENDIDRAISVCAADTNICVRSGSIDNAVDKLTVWAFSFWKWRITICINKFTVTLFSKRLRYCRRSTHPVEICNENMAWISETKYPGVTLDSKLAYKTHSA